MALGACAVHPERPAVETCERCGAFACHECVQFTDTHPQQTLCAPCHQRYFGASASSRSVTALVLALISINMCWPLGIVGWVLGEQEIAAIDRGEAPMKGRNLAVGAKWVGMFTTLLSAISLVIAAIFGVMALTKKL
jgi:hypothetical protein